VPDPTDSDTYTIEDRWPLKATAINPDLEKSDEKELLEERRQVIFHHVPKQDAARQIAGCAPIHLEPLFILQHAIHGVVNIATI